MRVYTEYVHNYSTYYTMHLELQFAFTHKAHLKKKKNNPLVKKTATFLNQVESMDKPNLSIKPEGFSSTM